MKAIHLISMALPILFMTKVAKSQIPAEAQQNQNSIGYNYDRGGNMIERKVQVFFSGRFAAPSIKQDSLPEMKVYPNPTNDFINIEGPLPENAKKAELLISTLNGQVMKRNVYTGEMKQIPVYDLAKGVYLLEFIYSKKQKDTYKIVIN